MKSINFASSMLILLAGCVSKPVVPDAVAPEVVTKTRLVDTSCSWVRPIYLDKSDILSDKTAREILAHDEAGAKHGCWPLKK